MSAICGKCGHEVDRYTQRFYSNRWIVSCFICENPRHSGFDSCVDPYSDLTLDHVTDPETGRPLRVTSKRQLLAAEKRLGFRSLVAHTDEAHFDDPPNVTPPDMFEAMSRRSTGIRPRGQEQGWMYPDVAKKMLAEIKEKKIDINTW